MGSCVVENNFNYPLIMGILNITSDSFSDGNMYVRSEDAVNHALKMIKDGANIIDIGAESTRPGAKPIDSATEISKLLPVLKELKSLINEHVSTSPYPSRGDYQSTASSRGDYQSTATSRGDYQSTAKGNEFR